MAFHKPFNILYTYVCVDGLLRRLIRGLKQRPDVHIKPNVREPTGDDLRTAIMAVLPHLADQHTRLKRREQKRTEKKRRRKKGGKTRTEEDRERIGRG